MFQNVAQIEIAELKDSLAYAESLLAKNLQEKEEIMRQNTDHSFAMRREQEKTREVDKAKKSLEGNMADLNKKLQRMEESEETVSNTFERHHF